MSSGRLRLVALVLAMSLLGLLLAVATPYYQTDDDAAMHLRSAGVVLTDQPSEFLLFIHPLLGLLLRQLYQWFPGWPWYPLHHLFAHLCIAVACAWLALRRWGIGGLMAAGFCMVVVQSHFIWNLQFTTVAMLTGMLGILLLRWGESKAELSLGTLMLVWGALIRYESFQACAALTVALAVADVLVRPCPRRWVWILLAIAGLFVAAPTSFRAYYEVHPEWAGFLDRNAMKGLITDSKVLTTQSIPKEAYEDSGLSEVDVQAFQEWLLDESDLLTEENIQPLYESIDPAEINRVDFWRRLDRLGVVMLRSPAGWMLLAGILLLPMFDLRPGGAWRVAAALLGVGALFARLLATDGRIQDHVVSPLLMCAFTVCLLEIGARRNWLEKRGARRLIALGLLCAIGGTAVLNVNRSLIWQRQRAAEERNALRMFEAVRALEGQTLAVLAGAFPFGKPAALRDPHATFDGLSLFLGATNAITPDYRRQRENLGIERLYPELVGNDQLAVWQLHRWQAVALHDLLSEKYDMQFAFERVLRHNGADIVVRIVPADPSSGTEPFKGFLPDSLFQFQ